MLMFGSSNDTDSLSITVIAGLFSENVACTFAPLALTASVSSNESVLLAPPPRPFVMVPETLALADVTVVVTEAV